jgi:hypothetical protein
MGESDMDDLTKILNRPCEYSNIDGVGELSMGFFFLSYSFLLWLQTHTPRTAIWHSMYAFIIGWGAMSLLIHYGAKAIKKYITYPRTGYVEYRVGKRRWIILTMSFGIAVLVSGGMGIAVRHHFSISTPFSLFGLVFAAAYIQFALKMHWKWIIFLVMLASTLIIAALSADLLDRVADHSHFGSAVSSQAVGAFLLTWVVYGGLFLISGLITFWLYLRHTQAPAQEIR